LAPEAEADMHMPFCTVADQCLRCDNVRAKREIERLRRVLRTTLDTLLDRTEELKDALAKVARTEKDLHDLRATRASRPYLITTCASRVLRNRQVTQGVIADLHVAHVVHDPRRLTYN
ncbi:hypothetical protein LCGC14_2365370, partial [marine sediment metagenome]